ncbi:MAG: phosphoribosylformimino-5-aminoimidazole carboxamide ribotide isomerase, partial [Methanosarcinales archaeon]|nr:phosphoribosylformimino-5-aminoimidazole carboxamide ribotide isomerase [Methanosarcinales archaeon]
MFRTILVLDIFDGIVVHAVRGMREQYLPIAGASSVCETSGAVEIVRAIDPDEVYAADLNRIRGGVAGDNFQVVRDISGYCKTILSCGVRSAEDALL